MKKRTSIIVSHQLLKMIDKLPHKPARSAIVEEALILYFKNRKALERDKSDLEKLNSLSEELNSEALDVLDYQVN